MKLSRMSLFAGCVLAVMLCLFIYPSATLGDEIRIEIDVAPNVLNIQSESSVVTVHTDIAYGSVVGSSVYLNMVEINYSKFDAQGNFVAKFLSDEIKALDELEVGEYNTLVLTGLTTEGDVFIGEQEIKIIDVLPQGKN
jgi:hypothetical protein